VLRNPPSIVKWHRMRGLFRARYFFCERMQKKRQLGIRAFFIFERCERSTKHSQQASHPLCQVIPLSPINLSVAMLSTEHVEQMCCQMFCSVNRLISKVQAGASKAIEAKSVGISTYCVEILTLVVKILMAAASLWF
jgi:hypothetical protein